MQLDSELKQSRVFPFATLVVSAFLGVVLLLFLAALTVSQLPVGWINQQLALRTLPILGEPLQFEGVERSEEHTSELQSHLNLVCRLLYPLNL
ncbi:MAG TPA: hypothetical protein DCF45_01450, partial [Gammaproteobacteria bacterium]|nr:hypothetical protein [Gammaproteobacteria bacterium]